MAKQMTTRKRKQRPAVVILITAFVLVSLTLVVLFLMGFRYISTDKGVKYIGKTANGQPINGYINYTNGEKATLDYTEKKITFKNGDVYIGDISGVFRDGKGVMTYAATGDRYEGDFNDDEITGTGTYTYSNGDVYTGALLNGKMHGYGIISFTSGAKYEGNFNNGLRSGNGIYTWSTGAKYEGAFLDDIKNGYGKMYYANGDYYEGLFVSDKRHGSGYYKWADEESYKGNFVNNLIDTRALDDNGEFLKNSDGTYVHGTQGIYTFNTGRTYTGYFEAGQVIGVDFNIDEVQE